MIKNVTEINDKNVNENDKKMKIKKDNQNNNYKRYIIH